MGDTENTFWKDGEIRFLDNTPEPRAALFIQQPIKMLLLRKRSEDQDHLFLSIFHCSGKFSAFRTWILGPAIKVLFETFSALILLFRPYAQHGQRSGPRSDERLGPRSGPGIFVFYFSNRNIFFEII